MGKITVNVIVLNHKTQKFTTMFRNVKLDVIECSNKRMNEAFEFQHPSLFRKIPRWTEYTNGMNITYISAFECKVTKY